LYVNIYALEAYRQELELNKKQLKPKAAKADTGVSDRWAVVWRGGIGELGSCSYSYYTCIHPTAYCLHLVTSTLLRLSCLLGSYEDARATEEGREGGEADIYRSVYHILYTTHDNSTQSGTPTTQTVYVIWRIKRIEQLCFFVLQGRCDVEQVYDDVAI
jgi:hypothetical protein